MVRAIFPGSFDPVTNGHIDLIERALTMFDRVTVAVLVNAAKKPLFSQDERLELIQACLPSERVDVAFFQGLLVDFAHDCGASVIVRGLRAVSDFEYELQMAMMNRELASDVETVFLMPKHDYSYLSSRLVKEVASLNGDVSKHVPELIKKALDRKFKRHPG